MAPGIRDSVVGNALKDSCYSESYKVKSESSDRRYLTGGISPRYSPGGNRIAVARYGPDRISHIWLIDPDGSNCK